jgi:hypothetical protein
MQYNKSIRYHFQNQVEHKVSIFPIQKINYIAWKKSNALLPNPKFPIFTQFLTIILNQKHQNMHAHSHKVMGLIIIFTWR